MQDIADATGLTVKTVSRALSGAANVRPATRERVLAEARRIGFQRNDVAAGLRRNGQRTRTIGVMLSDLSNPFFPPLLRGIHEVAARHGYPVVVAEAQGDPSQERAAIEGLLAQRVSGLIITPTGTDFAFLESELDYGSVLVFVDSTPLGSRADSVTTSNLQSAREVVSQLIGAGHSRVAFLGHPDFGYGAPLRWRGYVEAHEAAGLPVDDALVRRGLTTAPQASEAVDDIVRSVADPPTAVFADNNRLTVGVLRSRAYAEREFALAGFDRVDFAEQFGITTVDTRPLEVGRAGAELFFERLAHPGLEYRSVHVGALVTAGGRPAFRPVGRPADATPGGVRVSGP